MSVLLNKASKCYPLRKLVTSKCHCLQRRKFSDVPRKFSTFDEVVLQRRAEAKRSLVVQVNSESSFNELFGYCSKYSVINGIHHYRNSSQEHFMLIEFNSEGSLKHVLQHCGSHQKDLDVMAVQSPFVWFRAVSGNKEKFTVPPEGFKLLTKDGITPVNEDELFSDLYKCVDVSEQIQMLYDRTVLNDLGVRLRYLVARQLEILFSSLYANVVVQPFGSSVNGFGKMGCDLDLVLTNVVTDEMSSPRRRLVFQEKKCEGGRSPGQRHLELVGELLELRAAGAARVQRILHARVPIVKCAHELAALDCDLCYTNLSGVHMSELLWALGSLDARCRPLVQAVRRWARGAALTAALPGRWITNFPLSLLVLFYLQQRGILPPKDLLVKLAEKSDARIGEEGINCTFLRDMNKLPPDTYGQNTDNLERLLLGFFEYYSQFDFKDQAISINEGKPIRKPNNSPLYIVNPLEPALNVSRNVSYEECERLKLEVRNAAWHLEAVLEGNKTDDWGILGLIEKRSVRSLKNLLKVGNSQRLVSVKDLFREDEDELSQNKVEKNSKLNTGSLTNSVKVEKQEQSAKFKNSQVANQVKRIRRNKIL